MFGIELEGPWSETPDPIRLTSDGRVRLVCENCGDPEAYPVQSYTAYAPVRRSATERLLRDDAEPFDPPPDPNPPRNFCSVCAEEYNAYWEERWREAREGCL